MAGADSLRPDSPRPDCSNGDQALMGDACRVAAGGIGATMHGSCVHCTRCGGCALCILQRQENGDLPSRRGFSHISRLSAPACRSRGTIWRVASKGKRAVFPQHSRFSPLWSHAMRPPSRGVGARDTWNQTKRAIAGSVFAASLFIAGGSGCASNIRGGEARDSVEAARQINRQTTSASELDPALVDFLVSAAERRLMTSAEGTLAASHATAPEIRTYGERMIKDEAMLLERLQLLAGRVGIHLPEAIGESKQKKLDELGALQAEDFDEKFIQMITAGHKRDVQAFEFATKFENPDVRQFAIENRAMIERQLAEITALPSRGARESTPSFSSDKPTK
jgi:putative membrane protein